LHKFQIFIGISLRKGFHFAFEFFRLSSLEDRKIKRPNRNEMFWIDISMKFNSITKKPEKSLHFSITFIRAGGLWVHEKFV